MRRVAALLLVLALPGSALAITEFGAEDATVAKVAKSRSVSQDDVSVSSCKKLRSGKYRCSYRYDSEADGSCAGTAIVASKRSVSLQRGERCSG